MLDEALLKQADTMKAVVNEAVTSAMSTINKDIEEIKEDVKRKGEQLSDMDGRVEQLEQQARRNSL